MEKSKQDTPKQPQPNASRRKMLKIAGASLVAAAATWGAYKGVSSLSSTKNNLGISKNKTPKGSMTYRLAPCSGDKVSLLGFGCMRFPVKKEGERVGSWFNEEIDEAAVQPLVDYAIQHGVNYFDTAPVYGNGKSEGVIGRALKKHPRERFFLATKMSAQACKSREEALAMYHHSFQECQVDYFDYYLLHALKSIEEYQLRYQKWGLLDFLVAQKKEGKIRNLGWSFHGDRALFEYMLDQPIPWDFVQIQMNYPEWKNAEIPAEWMYNKLTERNIPVIIMEPLLGGRLSKLNQFAVDLLKEDRPQESVASWAFRFAGSFSNVLCVLSGMTYMEHLQDNVATYSPLEPLSPQEFQRLNKVVELLEQYKTIPCTECNYCMPCPYGIRIPDLFAHYNRCLNENNIPKSRKDADFRKQRRAFLVDYWRSIPESSRADRCTGCEQCTASCPQNIKIPKELRRIDELVEAAEKKLG